MGSDACDACDAGRRRGEAGGRGMDPDPDAWRVGVRGVCGGVRGVWEPLGVPGVLGGLPGARDMLLVLFALSEAAVAE